MGSMLRRCNNWDYRQRAIYMVTLTVAERLPLLGRLAGDESAATIVPTNVGAMAAACWRDIPARYPGVVLMEYQVMPDHFHGIVFVQEPQAKPLGAIVGAFKSHSSSLFKTGHAACGLAQDGMDRPAGGVLCPPACGPGLWSSGYQDTILFRQGQLARMRAYVLDNPRRLAVKRAHPGLFRIVRDFPCCGTPMAAIGNHFLLDRPVKRQVLCSRSIPTDGLAALQSELLAAARHGAVLVSPCISPGEKQISRAALDAGLPLIVLLENGFPTHYKPPGTYFDACAAGRLLMLAPWPHHSDKRTITRDQCLALNRFAVAIAND